MKFRKCKKTKRPSGVGGGQEGSVLGVEKQTEGQLQRGCNNLISGQVSPSPL